MTAIGNRRENQGLIPALQREPPAFNGTSN